MNILTHRVYDSSAPVAGACFLIDRLWPRGIKKADLRCDAWLKDAAPSTQLRMWYQHDPEKWVEFKKRYFSELDKKPQSWKPILEAARKGPVTLLYSSRETKLNNAVALKEFLEKKIASSTKAKN